MVMMVTMQDEVSARLHMSTVRRNLALAYGGPSELDPRLTVTSQNQSDSSSVTRKSSMLLKRLIRVPAVSRTESSVRSHAVVDAHTSV